MLTVDDWDVRFLAPVLPAVFVLAALELQTRWQPLKKVETQYLASHR